MLFRSIHYGCVVPHAELKFSSDIVLDTVALFEAIDRMIMDHDATAGDTKCRAYPATDYRHSHLIITVSLLTKPHRDTAFSKALMADLEALVKSFLSTPCYFSLSLQYSSDTYITNRFEPKETPPPSGDT